MKKIYPTLSLMAPLLAWSGKADGKVNKNTTTRIKKLVPSEERKNITNVTRKEEISNKDAPKTEVKKEGTNVKKGGR